MHTLTLKIPESLDAALQTASARRRLSKSAVVREALERALADELKQGSPAVNWVDRWRGVLRGQESTTTTDARVAHILNKHLR